jgi:hypothetical protein
MHCTIMIVLAWAQQAPAGLASTVRNISTIAAQLKPVTNAIQVGDIDAQSPDDEG